MYANERIDIILIMWYNNNEVKWILPNINDVQDKNSEAGIIATLIRHPDFIYQSEDLLPKHFFDEMNG